MVILYANVARSRYVDRITFGADGWPLPRTPGRRNRFPAGGVPTPAADRWRPDLNDNFNSSLLEGVSDGAGPLGSKWLFKQENESLWSLDGGHLALKTGAQPGIESPFPANMLLQRPTAAYYRIETKLIWPTGANSWFQAHFGPRSSL